MRVVHLHLSAQHTLYLVSFLNLQLPQLTPLGFSNNQEREKAVSNKGMRKKACSTSPYPNSPLCHRFPGWYWDLQILESLSTLREKLPPGLSQGGSLGYLSSHLLFLDPWDCYMCGLPKVHALVLILPWGFNTSRSFLKNNPYSFPTNFLPVCSNETRAHKVPSWSYSHRVICSFFVLWLCTTKDTMLLPLV
jgi:hypothetical protein